MTLTEGHDKLPETTATTLPANVVMRRLSGRMLSMVSDNRVTEEQRTILVLDDESALQIVLTRLLEAEGFRVVTANCGSEALATLAAHSERIALMIVDIKLPDMCGREFVHHAAARHGERPILYLSGVDPQGRSDFLHARTTFLAKPFENAELLSRVSELLAETR